MERGGDLLEFLAPSESGAECQTRIQSTTGLGGVHLEQVFKEMTWEASTLLDIWGESGSGKTDWIYAMCVSITTPMSLNLEESCTAQSVSIGGSGRRVLFVDTDHHFNAFRLTAMLSARIRTCVHVAGLAHDAHEHSIVRCIQECLDRIMVYRPKTLCDLYCTLFALSRERIAEMPLVVIDSLSSISLLPDSRMEPPIALGNAVDYVCRTLHARVVITQRPQGGRLPFDLDSTKKESVSHLPREVHEYPFFSNIRGNRIPRMHVVLRVIEGEKPAHQKDEMKVADVFVSSPGGSTVRRVFLAKDGPEGPIYQYKS
eukprot:TRINITY_DN839_c0_g1_i1.p1 TRINITY_DN839_c0_g1~~TRINITY_DN839_c0_g1_i1.p1  ORF type:complete len:361 (-),score=54.52 TRINITY_DN839_c0_g1_i1:584-1528(-)